MKNNTFTLVRREQDGIYTSVYVDMYEIPEELLEDSNPKPVLDYFRNIAEDWKKTDEGKKMLEDNCGYFNWNDFANIPERYLISYGVRSLPVTSYLIAEVEADEQL